jgi:hypothetical protein
VDRGIAINITQNNEFDYTPIGLKIHNMNRMSSLEHPSIGLQTIGFIPLTTGTCKNQENRMSFLLHELNVAEKYSSWNRADGNANIINSHDNLPYQGFNYQRAVTGIVNYNDFGWTDFDIAEGTCGFLDDTGFGELYGIRGIVRFDPGYTGALIDYQGNARCAAVYGRVESDYTYPLYPSDQWAAYFYGYGGKSYFSHAVGIGTEYPAREYMLDVVGRVRVESISVFADERMKTEIEDINDGLDIVKNLRGVQFKWKNPGLESWVPDGKIHIGLVAQEVKSVLPEALVGVDEAYKSVTYDKLVAVLIEAIKELNTRVVELEGKL